MHTKTLLVTGFQPFGGENINPSYEAVKYLPDKIGGWTLKKLELPVEFSTSIEVLKNAISNYTPDVVLSVGQAGGRNFITIERIAMNVKDSRVADNAGYIPEDEKIIENGPDGIFSNLPIKKMMKSVTDHNIPCAISNTAGTYVCNTVLYQALHLCNNEYPKMKAGFVHVPYIYEQITQRKINHPGMSLTDIVEALKYMIEAMDE